MNTTKCTSLRFGPRTLLNCSRGDSPYNIQGQIIQFSESHSDLGIIVDRNLKFHQHIRSVANSCNAISTNLFSSVLCRDENFIMEVFTTLIRPKMEYGSTVWSLGYLGDLRTLERVQRRWTKRINGLENLPYSDRLLHLNLFSVQGRLLRADMICTWKIFSGMCAISPEQIFTRDLSTRRGHSRKLFLPRTNKYIRKRFFSIRVIHPWNSLSEEAVSASSLTQFKFFLHRDLGQRLYEYAD